MYELDITINDGPLTEKLGASQVPLRVYENLGAEDLKQWFSDLASLDKGRAAFIACDSIEPLALLRLDEYREKVRFILLSLSEMRSVVAKGENGFQYIQDQTEASSQSAWRQDGLLLNADDVEKQETHGLIEICFRLGLGQAIATFEWENPDSSLARLIIREGTEIHRKLSLGDSNSIPLRIFEQLEARDIEAWYQELVGVEQQCRAAFVVCNELDWWPIHLCLHNYREEIQFIVLRFNSIKRAVREYESARKYILKEVTFYSEASQNHYINESYDFVWEDGKFFGRKVLVQDVTARINSGDNFFVYGLRKIGKTSMLYRLKNVNKLQEYIMEIVNLATPHPDSITDSYRNILRKIKEAIKAKCQDQDISLDLSKHPVFSLLERGANLSLLEKHFEEDLLALLNEIQEIPDLHFERMILLIDDIDAIVPDSYLDSPGIAGYDEFLERLHRLSRSTPALSIGMVAFTPVLREVIRSGRTPFFTQVREIPLGGLERSECNELVETIGRRMLLRYPDECLDAVFRATGGNPQIAKWLCGGLFALRNRDPGDVSLEEIEEAKNEFVDGVLPAVAAWGPARLKQIYEQFGYYYPNGKRILETIVDEWQEGCWADMDRLRQLTSFGEQTLKQALKELCDYGLLELKKNRDCRIQMGLLHKWLEQR